MKTSNLETRIEHLEQLNRWHINATNILIAMSEVYGKTNDHRDITSILNAAVSYVNQVESFEGLLFYLVEESDSSFQLAHTYPSTYESIDAVKLKQSLIDSGDFAWAIKQNRAIEIDSQFANRKILMHVLATKNRVRGMFIGFTFENRHINIAAQKLISVILQNTAQTLENNLLNNMLTEQNMQLENNNKQLKKKVQKKTKVLKQALIKAETATKSKSQFLANMSHEIRTPMNAISGFAYLLLQEDLSETQLRHVKQINTASGQLLNLINDILDLSKVEAEKLEVESIRFNLLHILDELKGVMEFASSEKSVPLTFEIPSNIRHHLEGDAHRLKQILTNLLSNAIKFSTNTEVKLTVSEHFDKDNNRTYTSFAVSDQGIGMTKSQLSRLFQSFSQVDSSRTRKYDGTGLGLAISKQLANLMGGKIDVISKYREGSTFTAVLPFNCTASEIVKSSFKDEVTAIDKKLPLIAGKQVLLVEDNMVNQMVATGLLKQFNLEITLASNGQEAAREVSQKRFDMIIMDIHMPVMDGFQASKTIRSDYSKDELPIIALTADAFKDVEQSCIDAGMNDFLAKPINVKILKNTLIKWLLD